ncbi:DNA-3-methyladenine glycosylase [Pontibacter sp. G13]|uniref:DNA-3-methyladenine glycosylase family protein n=1 Tax=Pontibacter sp. G13 TaxID=3074898 RepID=UPI00288B7988|nr:DNA-3-methyladenine glycosylase [Pontibacter sp. G13]WNJ18227.1 DNA-3-methyladenine glycosylase [Pontibacter sp. G13]
MHTRKIQLPADFSWQACLKQLDRNALEPLHRVSEGIWQKVLVLDEHPHLFYIGADEDTIEIATEDDLKDQSWREVEQWVKTSLDLDRNLTEFYQMAESDPILGPIVRQHRGLRLIRIPDLFETLIWCIIGQQINLAFAYQLKSRLVRTFGGHHLLAGQTWYTFPKPEALSDLDPAELKIMQFSRRKVEYIQEIAQQFLSGDLSQQELEQLNDPLAIRERLVKVRGIGDWTANYAMMRCLGLPNALPVGDAGLHQAIRKALDLDRKPTPSEVRAAADPWKGWESYATYYLWQSLS